MLTRIIGSRLLGGADSGGTVESVMLATQSASLLALYGGGESSGAVQDLSGAAPELETVNGSPVYGLAGVPGSELTAIRFDHADNDAIRHASDQAYWGNFFSGNWTIAFFARPSVQVPSIKWFFDYRSPSATTGTNLTMARWDGAGMANDEAQIFVRMGGTDYFANASGMVRDDWNMFYIRRAGNVLDARINEGPVLTLTSSAVAGNSQSNGRVTMGNRNEITEAADGRVQLMGFWSAALTNQELADIFNASDITT